MKKSLFANVSPCARRGQHVETNSVDIGKFGSGEQVSVDQETGLTRRSNALAVVVHDINFGPHRIAGSLRNHDR